MWVILLVWLPVCSAVTYSVLVFILILVQCGRFLWFDILSRRVPSYVAWLHVRHRPKLLWPADAGDSFGWQSLAVASRLLLFGRFWCRLEWFGPADSICSINRPCSSRSLLLGQSWFWFFWTAGSGVLLRSMYLHIPSCLLSIGCLVGSGRKRFGLADAIRLAFCPGPSLLLPLTSMLVTMKFVWFSVKHFLSRYRSVLIFGAKMIWPVDWSVGPSTAS